MLDAVGVIWGWAVILPESCHPGLVLGFGVGFSLVFGGWGCVLGTLKWFVEWVCEPLYSEGQDRFGRDCRADRGERRPQRQGRRAPGIGPH